MEYCIDLPLGYENCISEADWSLMLVFLLAAVGVFFVYLSDVFGGNDE